MTEKISNDFFHQISALSTEDKNLESKESKEKNTQNTEKPLENKELAKPIFDPLAIQPYNRAHTNHQMTTGISEVSTQAVNEKSSSSFWDEKPLEFFDELPSEDFLEQQANENSLKALLAPSNVLIEEIQKLLEEKHVKHVPSSIEDQYCEKQSFTIDNKRYILEDEAILQAVYKKVLNLNNNATIDHALKRRPPLSEIFKKNLSTENTFKEHTLLSTFSSNTLNRLIIRALCFLLTNKLMNRTEITNKETIKEDFLGESFELDLTFNKALIARNLGETIVDAFVTMNLIFNNATIEEKNQIESSTEEEIVSSTMRSEFDLLEIFKSLQENTEVYLEYTKYKIIDEMRSAVISELIDHCKQQIPPIILPHPTELSPEDTKIFAQKVIDYHVNVGLTIITWLKELGIFTESINKKNVPILCYNKTIFVDLLASGSFHKPPISVHNIAESYVRKSTNAEINLNIKTYKIKLGDSVEINASPQLKNILECYDTTKFVVDSQAVDFFFECLEEALKCSLKENKELQNDFINHFLRAAFHIDINMMLENNDNKQLIYKLREFGLNFNSHFDKDLKESCQHNIAAEQTYNKFSSYKFYIRGLLNDLNVYRHFNHFFIPHFITSTGRIFSHPYFLQLQGNKIVRAFITFKKYKKMTANQITEYEQIIHKHYPKLTNNYFFSNKYKDAELVNRFYNQARGLYNMQVFACLKTNLKPNLAEYEQLNNVQNKLEWLTLHANKDKDIFYLYLLIEAGKRNETDHLLYEKDATGSGPQIISYLTNNVSMARYTNIIQTATPQDLYMMFAQDVDTHMIAIQQALKNFYAEILKLDYDKRPAIPEGELTVKHLIQAIIETPLVEKFSAYFKTLIDYLYKDAILTEKIVKFPLPVVASKIKLDEFYGDNKKPNNKKKTKTKDRDKDPFLDPLFAVFTLLREFHSDYAIFKKIPKELISRKMFKHAVMTYGYAQGPASRIDAFINNIIEHYANLGFSAVPYNTIEVQQFGEFLNNSFEATANEILKSVKFFLNMTTNFVKKYARKGIKIPMEYLTWNFVLLDEVSYRHRFQEGETSHQFQLFYRFGIAEGRMRSTFPSIFVQGIDAHIVHRILFKIYIMINKDLKEKGLPLISLQTVHDCFCINSLNAHYLIPIVQDGYNSINELSFNQIPQLLNKLSTRIECTSRFFIKH